MSALQVDIAHSTLTGLRSRNEDYVGAATPEGDELDAKGMLLAVADGVGGHAQGREAAEYAVRNLLNDYFATPDTWGVAKSFDTVLTAANRWLLATARKNREYAGMATTLTALVLRGSRYYLGHVGDSRAYLWRAGVLTQLTEDHTWPHPELSNVLRRALGLDEHLVVDHADGELAVGDQFVLLTDGVWGTLGDAGINELLVRHAQGNAAAEAAANALALEAIRRGANDNCTALVAHVMTVPQSNLRDRLGGAQKLPLPPKLDAGDEIDGLRVIEVLHESRITLLYKVAQGNEILVLKTLRPEAGDAESIAALVHEEWLARRAVAPCFPQVISHPARAHLYYLMTWHEGESLKARLSRGHRFDVDEVAAIGLRLLKAVGLLHQLGIVHRDIKPDNIQIGTQGQITLLDLGVAASDGERLGEINNPGTPSYMAPELFAAGAANEMSDLYSCGVTLYELLTRKHPYGEIEPFQTPRFTQPTPPTRYRRDIPEWLETILLKACAREPAGRFETAEEFALALERGAYRPLTSARRIPLAARNPSLTLKVILGISLALNLVLAFWLSRQ
ncbi:MAG: protein kinase [Rugosibacter sp.]